MRDGYIAFTNKENFKFNNLKYSTEIFETLDFIWTDLRPQIPVTIAKKST